VVKLEALEALHYVALSGPLERGRFPAITGLPPRTARRVLASLLAFGLLLEESPRSPVRFGVPLASLRFLFPKLWPEAEPPDA
jgi:chromosome segregation and condensation protein ScpB